MSPEVHHRCTNGVAQLQARLAMISFPKLAAKPQSARTEIFSAESNIQSHFAGVVVHIQVAVTLS